jgi:hypothetical protein
MVMPVGVTLIDIGRQAQCRRRHPVLAFRLNGESSEMDCAQWLFLAWVAAIFHETNIGSHIESRDCGAALTKWLMRRFVADQFQLPDYPG